MSALKDLHNKLHSRDNKDLLDRESSMDSYDMDDLKNEEKKDSNVLNSDKFQDGNRETESLNFEKESFDNKDNNFNNVPQEVSLEPQNSSKNHLKWSNRKKFLIFGGITLLIVLILAGAMFYVRYIQNSFKQENVIVDFSGDSEVRSGEILEKKLIVDNENRIALKTAQIKVFYPEELKPIYSDFMKEGPSNSFYIDIGNLDKFEIREYPLQFETFSSFDHEIYLQTELTYQPDNFSSNFNKEGNHLVVIRGSVVGFSLISTNEAASGELLKFIGVLSNNGDEDFENLILELEHPDSFNLEKLELEKISDDDKKFKIPIIKRGEKREIEILGSFMDEVDSIKNLKAKIGLLKEDTFSEIISAEEAIKIIPSRIAISQEIINGVDLERMTTVAGDNLRYEINFKNNSSSPLTDLVLKSEITGDLIDLDSINAVNGYYDRDKKEIIWRASEVPSLKSLNPGEGGSVEFRFNTKSNFVPENERNQIIITQAKISSPNINTQILSNQEISSEEKIVKVETNLNVLVSGRHNNSVFNNTGPIPVKIGEETTFTVKIELKNDFNKINNPKITIKIPSGINWKNSYQRSSGEVSFNERTNELFWELDEVEDFVGYSKPLEELVFQLGIVPQNDASSNSIFLVRDVMFVGYDNFTGSMISKKIEDLNLRNVEDYEF
jgi:hypothetical protein